MKVRFLMDENVDRRISDGLRRLDPAIEITTHGAAGLTGLADVDVLRAAARAGQVLVTSDEGIGEALERLCAAGETSKGIIVVRQILPIDHAIRELQLIFTETAMEEWENRIHWLTK